MSDYTGAAADRFTGRCRFCGGELPETGFHSCNITGGFAVEWDDKKRIAALERELADTRASLARAAQDRDISMQKRGELERELAEAREQNARLLEAIRLEEENADFYFIADPECRLFVNLNDTFGYAVADAEPIPWDEFDAVITAWKADPVSLLVWAAQKRGYDLTALVGDAGVPPSTRDALRAWARREP